MINETKCTVARVDSEWVYGEVKVLGNQSKCVGITSLGRSVTGNDIPMISIGNEDSPKQILYVGTHHGMESITSAVLMKFAFEYADAVENRCRMYSISVPYIHRTRCIRIVPMLNPDGADISVNGVAESNPMRDRLVSMNGGGDFTEWQANANGVDLNHNYGFGFAEYKKIEAEAGITAGMTKYSGEYPESEPETAALASLIRRSGNIGMILTLHTQGEEIYAPCSDCLPRSASIARLFSRMSGYRLTVPSGTASYGGLSDWASCKMGIMSFTFECGCGKNPLPQSDFGDIYGRMREVLFSAPVSFELFTVYLHFNLL